MKRSEMLKLIGDAIGEVPAGYENVDASYKADDVLIAIEEAGMKPPRNSKHYCYYKHETPFDYIDELHDWDEE
jgi:hypothetical protein